MRDEFETAHIWLGSFPDRERLDLYFEEHYPDEDEDDYDRAERPLSEFAREQGIRRYDHDFLEVGFRPEAGSVEELVAGHSYHQHYETALTERAKALGLARCNTLVFLQDSPEHTRSVTGPDYWLCYLGTFTYPA